MPEFPHLPLRSEINGLYKSRGGGRRPGETTRANLQNRQGHGTSLLTSINQLSDSWADALAQRENQDLPELPDSNIVPIFLQIDPSAFDIESFKGFGIEIISEEDDGFIIGASADNFTSLRGKIQQFLNEEGRSKNQAAQLWQINDGIQWRVEQILSDELRERWEFIDDDESYVVDVGIACYVKLPEQPERDLDESEPHFQERMDRWATKKQALEIQRDEIAREREQKFEALVRAYNGELVSDYEDFEDSFSCRIRISGKGLKDIVLTYQFLFEVVEHDPFTVPETTQGESIEITPELIPPPQGAPKVCVIDSGIQEGHRLLAPAIEATSSTSFIPGDNSTADSVGNGGHGTRVAGAILYPNQIPRNGRYELICFLQNARILSGTDGALSSTLYPPSLMEGITNRFGDTRIFNLSVNSHRSCKLVHMSQWAASIDRVMHEKGVLFIISAGNINKSSGNPQNPGIKEHIRNNRPFPEYLLEKASRIANPAQSCFALTVGSVCIDGFDTDLKESFGQKDDPSSFSRTGPGLWGMIKPDVVEYGGDFVKEKNQNPNLSYEPSTCPELVKSTLNNGYAVGRDIVGTSFAAPKVSHVAARLQAEFPNESANFYRALIVQSARLPEHLFRNPVLANIRSFGYGITNLSRTVDNNPNRVTLISSGLVSAKKANVYYVKIPDEIRRPGEDYDILIEATLAYTAQPRRTRRRTQSYLSTWLDWQSSKLNENHDQFCQRIIQNLEGETQGGDDQNSIKWVIRENKDWSQIEGLRRQDSSLQKSWCVIKSYQLPQELSLAVIGHKGWNKDLSERIPYSIVVSFEVLNANINIYEMIRIENEVPIQVNIVQQVI